MVSVTHVLGLIAATALYCFGEASSATTGFQACSTAPATPEDRRVDTSKLTYATYNAEFLFLVGYGNLACPGDDCKWKTVTAAQNHIKQVASVLKALDADIVQLNEVEDCAVLRSVIAELQVLGDATYKPYLIRGTDSATGQNSALITRVDPTVDLQRSEVSVSLPVAQSKCPSASGFAKTKSVAKHFFTTFNAKGFSAPISVIGAHLLANPTNKQRCFEREGQATVLASLAQKAVASGNHVIMTGDWNDWSASALDRNSNKPISNALGILEGPGFVNAAAFADKNSRYTQWFDKNNDCTYALTEVSSLDHIVLSESLRSRVSNVTFHNSDLYTTSCTGFNSDHYPITVTLTPF